MSRLLLIAAALGATACSPAKGRWLGECGYGGDGTAVRLDVLSDDGGDLTASFEVSDLGGAYTLSGAGTRDGADLTIDLVSDDGSGPATSTFDATVDGHAMTGTWSRPSADGAVSADCTLSRD